MTLSKTAVRSVLPALVGAWTFGAGDAIAAAPTIPLCPGLQIVTALSQSNGDYESIKTIQTVSDSEVRLHYFLTGGWPSTATRTALAAISRTSNCPNGAPRQW